MANKRQSTTTSNRCPNSTSGKHCFEKEWSKGIFIHVATGKIICAYCGIYKG